MARGVMFGNRTCLLHSRSEMLMRSLKTALLVSLLLSAESLPAEEEIDSRGRSTAVALNYCRASFHRIRRYPSKAVLLEEQEKILNNLDLNGIADEEVIRLYTAVLDEIGQVQIADHEREMFKDRHARIIRREMGASAFVIGTQLATAQFGAAVRNGVNSWWDYREMTYHRDIDLWKVDKQRIGAVVSKSSTFLDTFWKMTQKKNIPDRWLVRSDDLVRLEEAMQEQDLAVRLRVLQRMERFMECYPPYWYYVARTQQGLGQLFAAAQTYDKLADLGAGHFRRDDMLAAGLANRAAIQEYLMQPGAAKTAKEALRYSTAVWQANLMCAQVLRRHGMYEEAEDAILRNLDVNLERTESLFALLALYHATSNHEKLIEMLSDPAVIHDSPAPALLECAALLGPERVPALALRRIEESFSVYPDLHFGPDDLVVAADPAWQLQKAQVSVEIGRMRFDQPQWAANEEQIEARFRGILRLGSPFNPRPDALHATVQLTYSNTAPIRVHVRRGVPSTAPADAAGGTLLGEALEEITASRPRSALVIAAVEVGSNLLPFGPTPAQAAVPSPAAPPPVSPPFAATPFVAPSSVSQQRPAAQEPYRPAAFPTPLPSPSTVGVNQRPNLPQNARQPVLPTLEPPVPIDETTPASSLQSPVEIMPPVAIPGDGQ